jgi:hypothetical protein
MKTKIKIEIIVLILFSVCPVKAATIWTEGYHQMIPGGIYGESSIYNDVRLDIYGGQISHVFAFNTTLTNWYDGQMYYFYARDNSIVNIFGGRASDFLNATDNSQINLHAYDVTYDDITHVIEGYYYKDNSHFWFELLHGQETYSHIRVVPEPSTLFLLGLGCLLLKIGKNKRT